ncbi:hypothetical protein HY991_01260 [Candidatus Micrarchaeota archaeon]|nr:hypothetical protein [Candidatus Micrarchaeota archaeon]
MEENVVEKEASAEAEKVARVKAKGIPAKRAIWFEYDRLPMPTTARWEYQDILKLVFPPVAQRAQYEIAGKLVLLLSRREEADGNVIAEWAKEEQIPNSTLRNLVIPKLIRVGILARERVAPTGLTEKDKRRPMILKLSTKFGDALKHIGEEWTSIVETWRVKRKSAKD